MKPSVMSRYSFPTTEAKSGWVPMLFCLAMAMTLISQVCTVRSSAASWEYDHQCSAQLIKGNIKLGEVGENTRDLSERSSSSVPGTIQTSTSKKAPIPSSTQVAMVSMLCTG